MASLSVIIPVYNSLSTLQRCVESVLAQRVGDMEIILVDDGSVDGSAALCDTLASEHHQVRTVHRVNGGLSAARNTGIERATGTWLSFVDSDDELAPGTLEPNLQIALSQPDTDLVEFPIMVHLGSPSAYSITFTPTRTSGVQVFTHWVESQGYNHCYACNKLFRATLFKSIRFPLRESFEDAAICPSIIKACRAVEYSDKGCYIYNQSHGSITLTYSFANQEPLFRHSLKLLSEITRLGFDKAGRARLWSFCLDRLIVLSRCHDANRNYIRSAAARLRTLKPGLSGLIRSGMPFKSRIKVLATAFLGVRCVCSILSTNKYR